VACTGELAMTGMGRTVAMTGQLRQGVTRWLGWRKGTEAQGANRAGERVMARRPVVATGGDRVASPVTGARKALISGTRLPGRERDRERARGVRADGWGRSVSGERHGVREGGRQAVWAGGARRAGGSWAGNGPTEGGRFFLFLFYFLFLISILYFFYPLFF
jgi:hypothetical protein